MRKLVPFLAFLVIFVGVSYADSPIVNQYRPIFMYRADMAENIRLKGPEAILDPGKIYLTGNWIFINEKFRGIHVIDNTNPADPTSFAFISIDGCIDMSIKGNVLYADNAVDLIAIRLNENLTDIKVTKRIENVFPELKSPEGRGLTWQEKMAKPDDAVIVRWDKI